MLNSIYAYVCYILFLIKLIYNGRVAYLRLLEIKGTIKPTTLAVVSTIFLLAAFTFILHWYPWAAVMAMTN